MPQGCTGSDILTLLRRETRPSHDRLEMRLALPECVCTVESYRSLLEDMFGFYEQIEQALFCLDWTGSGLALDRRWKLPLLEADLLALGRSPADLAALPRCPDVPRPRDRAGGLGCLYVLEGATLGGQIIARHVRDALGLGPERGCAFFCSYGGRVGEMWRAFRACLAAHCSEPTAAAAVVAAAIDTFDSLERWFCRPRP